ncbi:hypothetical protein JET14_05980 [Martelella lutilitoris]|uniref:Uncharacterized protein n=1 Tax=Martelella lutilitoris TaxID=2583532 RepID=A0A7T7KMF2_9HYPH|nr:hypothetical protein [Martelella lutilitoris]QQM31716.1 hypothetical protein JET14_05980 [Martelella lutilitoris]
MAEERDTGGVSSSEIESFITNSRLPELAGADDTIRFGVRVAKLINLRLAQRETGDFSAFILDQSLANQSPTKFDLKEFPLLANGADAVSGKLWLTSCTLRTSHELVLTWTDQASLFQTIRHADLSEKPTMIVDWRPSTPVVLFYRKGIKNQEDVVEVSLEDGPMSEHELEKALNLFYHRCLRTPALAAEGHAKKIWRKSDKGIPDPRPEEAIQGRLMDGLRVAFVKYNFRAETFTDDGRADIEIWRYSNSEGQKARVTDWILELKALADKTTTGSSVSDSKCREAIRSGLEQAVAYKQRLNAGRAALCCYDMRREDIGHEKCFTEIAESAATAEVPLWRWFLFRGTADSRKDQDYLNRAGG